MSDPTWQELLWTIPSAMGRGWYLLWGVVGGVSAVLIFVTAIMPQALSMMLAARILFCIGSTLILAGGINSGWQPWVPAFFALSALVGALALTIDRCDDQTPITIAGALWGRLKAAANAVRRAGRSPAP